MCEYKLYVFRCVQLCFCICWVPMSSILVTSLMFVGFPRNIKRVVHLVAFPILSRQLTSLMFACFLGTIKVAASLVTIGSSHTCFIYKNHVNHGLFIVSCNKLILLFLFLPIFSSCLVLFLFLLYPCTANLIRLSHLARYNECPTMNVPPFLRVSPHCPIPDSLTSLGR